MNLTKHKQRIADLFDGFAKARGHHVRRTSTYYRYLTKLVTHLVPNPRRVLELGSGTGDLLAALKPSHGVGVDLSGGMVEYAAERNSDLTFQQGDAETIELGEQFDTVLMVNLVGLLEDVYSAFGQAREHLAPDGRLVIVYYNHLWEPILRLASLLGLRSPLPHENWLPIADIENLLNLTGYETVRVGRRMLCPVFIPVVSWLLNKWIAPLPLIQRLCLVEYVVARLKPSVATSDRRGGVPDALRTSAPGDMQTDPQGADGEPVSHSLGEKESKPSADSPSPPVGEGRGEGLHEGLDRSRSKTLSCSVIVPTRNEKGNIEDAITRTVDMGRHTEFIFVDGHSTDGTVEEIHRVIKAFPERDIKFMEQDGIGKADAVRKAFDAATGDVLMILDSDLTMPPEDLPKYFDILAAGDAEFVNGCRLVYPMEKEAMRFLNKIANYLFGHLFSWLMEQRVRDTLCGTKVLSRENYLKIVENRSYFGDFDPFGDFDLLFGAARLNLKIVDLPIRYRERTYGEIKISRFTHGWLLIKMSAFAARKLKFQ